MLRFLKLILILIFVILFSGCSEKIIYVNKYPNIRLETFGSSKQELKVKGKVKTINNNKNICIKEENFKNVITFVNDLKTNLEKYEMQTNKINKLFDEGNQYGTDK